ncbi:UDP-N-acetylglucosamine 2-epimerase [Candidatus Syntrophocurvum alkaliphilum]|uniref:UDP-N-acetylglucosamine 2-epimerase (non-hydrolyzing) n=1 Tax=Candidatus Syntrophocurvum alkaliphilum TaxID=2293317 RepID=A0A6I6DCR4_9FIRM|nr:UDP-N-acetylglucosamine 2-epimerase (non-hydrolyzing) [Candidatus Syntrophocurvum alkaliphilum]QGU00445.1 UDP-N-acetylglucosamine 2-epimerase [Candidatus Syntrophocurvum alkaliphilum]
MGIHLGKVMVVFGTRPEAIKMAPVINELKMEEDINTIVAVTAQHRDMLDQVLNLFNIKPDYDLNLMKQQQDLYSVTSEVLTGMKEILEKEKPSLVLVHGDTTTTFAAALAAFYQKIPVGHVEAGLRTKNKYSPFPEEMNRTLTGKLAELHFAPTDTSRENLLREAAANFKIWVTGNTVIDALLTTIKDDYQFPKELSKINFNNRILLVTTHRRENWGEKMRQIYGALIDLVEEFTDIEVVFPVHKNPIVKDIAHEMLGDKERIHLIEPLDYEPFANLMNASHIILTDSGGMQEEAPSLGKPVLVLRDTTERPEAVEAGTVKLTGTVHEHIYNDTKQLLTNTQEYEKMAKAINPYGDGKAAKRIIKTIKEFLYVRIGNLN